jgi:hypothetical protein
MSSNIIELREREFERYVEGLYTGEPDRWGTICAAVPWSRRGWHFRQEEIPQLIREIRGALDAKLRHRRQASAWAQPLPIALEDCFDLMCRGDRQELLGRYGSSLWFSAYDPAHPPFFNYACGVMASVEYAPATLRDNMELRLQFPPTPLPGLSVGLLWHPT